MFFKRLIAIVIVSLVVLFLVVKTNNETIDYSENLDKYVQTLEYHDNFNILQLTDIHWSTSTNIEESKKYITKIIDETSRHVNSRYGTDSLTSKIDLIEITGDIFMLANTRLVTEFIKFMESFEIPYAVTWGEHDAEGIYSADWLSKQFANAEHSLYVEVDNDNLTGRSNYFINLVNKVNGKTVWQICNLDSGKTYRKNTESIFNLEYDYIREDQIKWFKLMHQEYNENANVLCYYHMAQKEFTNAYKNVLNPNVDDTTNTYSSKFFMLDDFNISTKANSITDVYKICNVKGCFVGHSHDNDIVISQKYLSGNTFKTILYGCGVKTGTEYDHANTSSLDGTCNPGFDIYEDFDLIGASLVTINNSSDITLEHFYLNERVGESDFTRWVEF